MNTRRKLSILILLSFIILFSSVSFSAADTPVGWSVFANGGKVYRCEVSGTPEELYDGSVAHACWSSDGRYIFFIKTSGEIWAMNNDGSNVRQLTDDTINTAECPIGPFRPDPEYVLYVEGTDFYKINAWNGEKVLLHSDSGTYVGEIAINSDGTRIAARDDLHDLYKIAVGGSRTRYSVGLCSSSISPDGEYLTENQTGHTQLIIYDWAGAVYKTLTVPSGLNWDNQKYSANSGDYIVYKIESGATSVGLVRVSDEENFQIGNLSSEHPDFFLGQLPYRTKIMPLGDSITKGSGVCYEPDTYLNCTGYRDYLWNELTDNGHIVDFVGGEGGQFQYQYTHDNDHEGHGGWTPSQIDDNISGWLNTHAPDIVLLHIGTNNTSQSSDVNDILDKIDAYESSNKHVTVILALIINRMTYHEPTTLFNDAIEAIALTRIGNGDDIIVVDMEDGAGINYSTDMTDSLHPNAAGYEKMAALWYTALTGILSNDVYPPIINSSPVTNIILGSLYSYDVNASGNPDPNFSLITSPAGMTINPATGMIEWTPASAGDVNVAVQAANSEGSDEQDFTISVQEQSFTPGIAPIDTITATGNAGWILTVTFDSIIFDACDGDLVLGTSTRYDSGDNVYTGGSYPTEDADNFSIGLMTSLDSCSYIETMFSESATTFFVFENSGNDDATVQGLDSGGNLVGSPVSILAGSADYGDTPYTSGVGSQPVKGFAFTSETPIYGIRITDGGPGFDPISISAAAVSDVNIPPVITSTPVTSGIVGQLYNYDVDATGVPAPTYSLTISPAGMTINPTTGLIAWTPSSTGDYDVTVAASNGNVPDANQNFSINVTEASSPNCPSGIIHYWKLDEDTGETYEDSLGGADASCAGGSCPAYDINGQVNGCQDFDGGANKISTGGVTNPDSEITVMAWVRREGALGSTDQGIIYKDGAFILELEGGSSFSIDFSLYVDGAHQELQATDSTALDTWTHYAATFDGSEMVVYKDGSFLDSMTVSGSITTNTNPYTIGQSVWITEERYFNGKIDEVAVFDRALEATEIQELYESSAAGNSYCELEPFTPTITSTPITNATVGELYSYNVDATGYPAPTYLLTSSPAGMTINSTTGLIEWTPASTGDYDVTVTAGNGVAPDANQSFTISVTDMTSCEPIIIMPLGDSITKGSTGMGEPESDKIGYRWYLHELLIDAGYTFDFVGSEEHGTTSGYVFDYDHEGHGGWTDTDIANTVYGFLEGVYNDLGVHVEIALLHIGTNGLDPSPDDVNDILDEIDRYETTYGTHITVFLARIINHKAYSSTVTQFNDNIENLANWRIANLGDDIIMVDMEDGAGIDYPNDMYDDIHPKLSGYEKMANLWFEHLDSFLLGQCPGDMTHYWKLEEPGPVYTDYYGDNDAVCVDGNCPDSVNGIVNNALCFSGEDAVYVSDDGTFNWGPDDSFSIEFWMKKDTACSGTSSNENNVIVGRATVGSTHWWVGVNCNASDGQGKVKLNLNDGSTALFSATNVIDSNWHHVVAIREVNGGSKYNRLYIDGVMEDEESHNSTTSFDFSGEPLTIGWINLTGGYYFDGVVDEIALYNQALTEGQIEQHYANGLCGLGYCSAAGPSPVAPLITSSPALTAYPGYLYEYDVEASGMPAPEYSLLENPAGMMIDSNTGLIQWTPDVSQLGNNDVNVMAQNFEGTDTQSFTISVIEPPPCPNGIVHYWKLDEIAGPPYEDSFGTLDASCTSCPSSSAGQVSNSLDFDGLNNHLLTSTASNPASEITLMAWINPDDLSTHDRGIISKADAFVLEVESDGSEISFSILDNGTHYEFESDVAGNEIQTGTWTHVAVTFNGTTATLYLNGNYIDSANPASVSAVTNSTEPYYIGWTSHTEWGADRYFDGKIDEVAVFNEALDAAVIQQLYNNGVQGNGYCLEQDYVTVPDVVGMTQAAAESEIISADLIVGSVDTAYSPTIPIGVVISQDPAAGLSVFIGSAVDIVVSLGSAGQTISGHVLETDGNTPIEDVAIDVNNGGVSDTTDVNGFYEVFVPYDWSGKIIPDKEGWVFAPENYSFDNVTSDINDVNFVGVMITFSISGYITETDEITSINDVNVSAENHGGEYTSRYGGWSDTTDLNGFYQIVVDYNWSGAVIPSKEGYSFEPNNQRDYTNVLTDFNEQNYLGTYFTYSISGYVIDPANRALMAVVVDANNGGGQSTTDESGYYELWVGDNWSGTVLPSLTNYIFEPNGIDYFDVTSDLQDDYFGYHYADINIDGFFDANDLELISQYWLVIDAPFGNLNDDNIVNFLDLAEFAQFWQDNCNFCMVQVPDVVGMTESEAQDSLNFVGLITGNVTYDFNNTIPAGEVISSSPAAGTFIAYGSSIDINVSAGPCQVTVPDVTEQTQADANSMIIAAGLTVGTISYNCSDTVPADSVISQNPQAGVLADCNSPVDIIISDGACGVPEWLGIDSSYIDSFCGELRLRELSRALDGTGVWEHPEHVDESPHWFILDLGTSYNVQKVRGRSNSESDPTDVNIYVSDGKGDFGTAVASGITTWQDTDSRIEVDITDKTGRYIMVEIISVEDINGQIIFGQSSPSFTVFDVFAAPTGP